MTISEMLNKQLITRVEANDMVLDKVTQIVTAMMPTVPFEGEGVAWTAQHPDWDECIFQIDTFLHKQGLFNAEQEEESYANAVFALNLIRKSKWYELLHEESCEEYYNQVMDRKELQNELRYRP